MNVPFIFESVSELKYFYFNISFSIMLEDFFVRLPLSVLQAVEVGRIRFALIAGFEVCEVALYIAGGTTATRSGEPYVGGHDWGRVVVECVLRKECKQQK
jgi:hypothetical protein